MEIHFTTATQYSADDLLRWIGLEYDQRDGVWAGGHEPAFASSTAGAADLAIPEGGDQWAFYRGDYRLSGGDAAYYTSHLETPAPTWITAWSGFTYSLIGREEADFSDVMRPTPGRDIWVYRGARRGFLKQNLLLPLPDPQVLWVKGTHGEFSGPAAFQRYWDVAEPVIYAAR